MKDLTNLIVEAGAMASKGRRDVMKAGFAAGVAGVLALTGENLISPSVALADDIATANVALGLEHQAIAAYKLGAGTGLLSGKPLELAGLFLSQHEAHRDALIGVIKKAGKTPVAAKANYNFDTSGIKGANDVLAFALKLEEGAASAYLGVLKGFKNKELLPVLAGIAADEAQHCAILRFALGQNPCPDAIVK